MGSRTGDRIGKQSPVSPPQALHLLHCCPGLPQRSGETVGERPAFPADIGFYFQSYGVIETERVGGLEGKVSAAIQRRGGGKHTHKEESEAGPETKPGPLQLPSLNSLEGCVTQTEVASSSRSRIRSSHGLLCQQRLSQKSFLGALTSLNIPASFLPVCKNYPLGPGNFTRHGPTAAKATDLPL